MKKFKGIWLIISTLVLIIGCGTTSGNQNKQNLGQMGQMRLLDLNEVVNRKLIGSDDNSVYSLIFRDNGILEYTVNDDLFTGTWKFQKNEKMYRYDVSWMEGEKRKSYIMDFFAKGEKIDWAGHSTTAYAPFSKEFTFEN